MVIGYIKYLVYSHFLPRTNAREGVYVMDKSHMLWSRHSLSDIAIKQPLSIKIEWLFLPRKFTCRIEHLGIAQISQC